MSFKPTKKEVVDAITTYSPERLQYLIDNGYDLNLPLLGENEIDFYDITDKKNEPGSEQLVALADGDQFMQLAFPLHIAIVCLYHSAIKYPSPSREEHEAIRIIEILLKNGARWDNGCGDIVTLNAEGFDWVQFRAAYPNNLALHLAMDLKKYLGRNGSHKLMDKGIKLLQDASIKDKKAKETTKPKITSVLEGVVTSYKSMLFSDDFSDITFQCSDGVSIPAHKCILAASSSYFQTAFRGDWAENNEEGVWKTAHCSNLMKSILTLIYTGSVKECEKLMDEKGTTDPLNLLDVACEYDIKHLIEISVDNCVRKLRLDNVQKMLQYAHVHSPRLKTACFEFIKKNTAKALMDPGMMGLAADDPALWGELGVFLNAKPEKPSKRARDS